MWFNQGPQNGADQPQLTQHNFPGTCPKSCPPFNPKNQANTAMSGIIKQTSG